jgi:hypothetical protein
VAAKETVIGTNPVPTVMSFGNGIKNVAAIAATPTNVVIGVI